MRWFPISLTGAVLASSIALAADEPDRVTMSLDEFLQLYDKAKEDPTKPDPDPIPPRAFVLSSANYNGEVLLEDGDPVSAVFTAKMRVEVLQQKGWVTVPLLPATVAVRSARVGGKEAPLVLQHGYYQLVTDQKGAVDVSITFAVGVDTAQGSSGFSFGLVAAGAPDLSLAVPSRDDLLFTVPGAHLKTDKQVGNNRVLEATLPSTGTLAVRWQKEVSAQEAKEQEPKLYAEVHSLVGIGDGLLNVHATVENTILFNGVSAFTAQIPDEMTVLDVSGVGINDWTVSDDGTLSVLLNYAAEGFYSYSMDLERPLANGSEQSTEAPLVVPLGVERSKGWVGVQALGTLELEPGAVTGATPVDVRALPPAILGITSQPVLLGYKYLGDEVSLPINVSQHEEVDVLVTLLDQVNATTMFTDDGRRLSSVQYQVRNNRRQFLRLVMPEGAELWSASVAGRSVQPAKSAGKLLLPLVRSSQGSGGALAAFSVEVVYVESGEGPDDGGKGAFKANLPKADVPATYAAWTVYAPWRATVGKDFEGTMRHVDYPSYPVSSTEVLQVDAYNAPVQEVARGQASSGGLGQGAAPVQVNLPLDGQTVYFEKLLILDQDDLWVSFDYKGLKK